MAYDGKILHRAMQRFELDRQQRRERYWNIMENVYASQPRIEQIDQSLRSTMSQVLMDALRKGADPKTALDRLQDENLDLQAERRRLLARLGMEGNEEKPLCPLCGDTGYHKGDVCRCLRTYYAQEQQKELSRMLDLGNQSFDTFSLQWYSNQVPDGQRRSARSHMEERVYNSCAEFAHGFGRHHRNLLLFGAPGLGKTHLSAAIAREVSGKGYSVVYDTAGHVFSRFENQKFIREEEAEDDVSRVLNCDLLILDDLGTEMTTTFVHSALYQMINTRLMEKRSTIISTNLTPEKLADRYTPQIVSRIEGEYQLLPFVGEDIRKLKKKESQP